MRPAARAPRAPRRCSLDLIIANGHVIDGTGLPAVRADIGIENDRIVAIATTLEANAGARIDARGGVIAPGFIDLHSHSDLCLSLPVEHQGRLLEGRVRQGITTELMGNCGIGCAPVTDITRRQVAAVCGFITPDGVPWDWSSMSSYLDLLESQGVLLNVATLVAHGPARAAAMGSRAGRPTPAEQQIMNREVRDAVDQGAYGVSFGLIYPPGQFADTHELIAVARAAASAGGFAAFHQRGSSLETLEPAVREIVEVGRRSEASVHHSHVETVGPRAWSGTQAVLDLHDEALRDGVDLTADVIPYTAVCTTMLALYPPWSLDGGVMAFLDRLGDPQIRARMKEEMAVIAPVWPPWEDAGRWTMNIVRECGWNRIHLAHVEGEANKSYEHLTLAELGARRGGDPFDALSDLLLEEQGIATQLIFGISGDDRNDADLLPLLRHPRLSFVTDAWEIGKGFPHPGAYGAFPRVLGQYVRERGVLPLEEAIRKMTSQPASRLGLRDRGQIRKGFKADLVVLDPSKIMDRSTFTEPRRHAAGVDEVIINGVRVVKGGTYHPVAAGRVLRRGGTV
jgi:N-acyl-D-aspartate/D-glutamate deacylase